MRLSYLQLPQPCCSSSVLSAFSSCHSHSSQRLSVSFQQGCPGCDGLRQVHPSWYLSSGHRSTCLSLIVNLLSSAEASTQAFSIFIISMLPWRRDSQQRRPTKQSPSPQPCLGCSAQGWLIPMHLTDDLPLLGNLALLCFPPLFLKLRMCFLHPQPSKVCWGTLVIFAKEMLPTLLKSSSKSRG